MKQNGAKWTRNEAKCSWLKQNILKWKWLKRKKSEIKQIAKLMVENEIEVSCMNPDIGYMSVTLYACKL